MKSLESGNELDLPGDSSKTIRTKIGLLTMPTGVGKTLTMLWHIRKNKCPTHANGRNVSEVRESYEGFVRVKTAVNGLTLLPVTVVISTSGICDLWVDENRKHHAALNVVNVAENDKLAADFNLFALRCDVIVSTPKVFDQILARYPSVMFWRVVIDEAPVFRNSAIKRTYHASFRWLLTGTPSALSVRKPSRKNQQAGLFSTSLCGMTPDVMKAISVKPCVSAQLMQQCEVTYTTVSFQYPRWVRMFAAALSPFQLDQLQHGSLPKKVPKNKRHDATFFAMNKLFVCEYGVFLNERVQEARQRVVDEEQTGEVAANRREARRQLQDRVREKRDFFRFFENLVSEECSICKSDTLQTPTYLLQCQHGFCNTCITNWIAIRASCPMCRGNLQLSKYPLQTLDSDLFFSDDNDDNDDDEPDEEAEDIIRSEDRTSIRGEANEETHRTPRQQREEQTQVRRTGAPSRLEALCNVVRSTRAGAKIIVVQLGNQQLTPRGNPHSLELTSLVDIYRLKGGGKNARSVLKKFNEVDASSTKKQLLHLSSYKECVGFNLPNTTDIVFYDEDISETCRKQAIARAVRIDRASRVLNVYYLKALSQRA